jgi:hypothetical protein
MTQGKAQRIAEARKHLKLAKGQWDDASTAWWPPTNAADCVSKSFYGYENAVVAAAVALKLPWKKTHPDKQRVATELASAGKVTTDISALLANLDKLRKDVSYDEPGPELQVVDLEDLINGLETFLEDVERIIQDVEDA